MAKYAVSVICKFSVLRFTLFKNSIYGPFILIREDALKINGGMRE